MWAVIRTRRAYTISNRRFGLRSHRRGGTARNARQSPPRRENNRAPPTFRGSFASIRHGCARVRRPRRRDRIVRATQSGAADGREAARRRPTRSEEHTSEVQSLMRLSYAVFCLKKKKKKAQQEIWNVDNELKI